MRQSAGPSPAPRTGGPVTATPPRAGGSVTAPPTRTGGPVTAPPTGKVWCITKPGADEKTLEANLNYACGQGIDCRPIQPGGPCYSPNTVACHAAYAMNAYYQAAGRNSWNCDFGQTGTLTSTDPSMHVKSSFLRPLLLCLKTPLDLTTQTTSSLHRTL